MINFMLSKEKTSTITQITLQRTMSLEKKKKFQKEKIKGEKNKERSSDRP